jgi:hypothetical protein
MRDALAKKRCADLVLALALAAHHLAHPATRSSAWAMLVPARTRPSMRTESSVCSCLCCGRQLQPRQLWSSRSLRHHSCLRRVAWRGRLRLGCGTCRSTSQWRTFCASKGRHRSAGTTSCWCGVCSSRSSRVGSLTRPVAGTAPPIRSSSRRTVRDFCKRSRHCRCGVRSGSARARQSTGRRHPTASALAAASLSASRAAARALSHFTTANFATRSQPP